MAEGAFFPGFYRLREQFWNPPVPLEKIDMKKVAEMIVVRLGRRRKKVQEEPFSIYQLLARFGYYKQDLFGIFRARRDRVEVFEAALSKTRGALRELISQEAIRRVPYDPDNISKKDEDGELIWYQVSDMEKIRGIAVQDKDE